MTRRLALITGASAGIGLEFARVYAEKGFDVALIARRRERLEEVAAELRAAHQVDALVIVADLADPGAAQSILAAVDAAGRTPDVLVNNAGYNIHNPYHVISWPEQAKFIQSMFTTPLELFHRVIPGMVARGYGRIINVSSMASAMPALPGDALYCGVKTGITKLTWAVNAELQNTGVHVTSLCPGNTRTEIFAKSGTVEAASAFPEWSWEMPREVAECGYDAVERNVPVEWSGWKNKLIAFIMKHAPTWLARRAVARVGRQKYPDSTRK